MNEHKLEWYIAETNSFIYDDDVVKLITPKLEKAKRCLEGVEDFIQFTKDEGELTDGNIVSNYLGYNGLLEEIYETLDTYFKYQK